MQKRSAGRRCVSEAASSSVIYEKTKLDFVFSHPGEMRRCEFPRDLEDIRPLSFSDHKKEKTEKKLKGGEIGAGKGGPRPSSPAHGGEKTSKKKLKQGRSPEMVKAELKGRKRISRQPPKAPSIADAIWRAGGKRSTAMGARGPGEEDCTKKGSRCCRSAGNRNATRCWNRGPQIKKRNKNKERKPDRKRDPNGSTLARIDAAACTRATLIRKKQRKRV